MNAIIFLCELIPAILILRYAFYYVIVKFNDQEKYHKICDSIKEFLLKYPVIGIVSFIAGIYVIYQSVFSLYATDIETMYRVLNLVIAFLDILYSLTVCALVLSNHNRYK